MKIFLLHECMKKGNRFLPVPFAWYWIFRIGDKTMINRKVQHSYQNVALSFLIILSELIQNTLGVFGNIFDFLFFIISWKQRIMRKKFHPFYILTDKSEDGPNFFAISSLLLSYLSEIRFCPFRPSVLRNLRCYLGVMSIFPLWSSGRITCLTASSNIPIVLSDNPSIVSRNSICDVWHDITSH